MFNTIIETLLNKGNIKYFIENPNEIEKVIHSTQEAMIVSALSMYSSTYPEIYYAVNEVLSNQLFVIDGKELKQIVKQTIKVINKDQISLRTTSEQINYNRLNFLDEDELSRILLESGLVGPYMLKHNMIKANNPVLKNKENICVMYADFNFDVSAITVNYKIHTKYQYIIHPMCYEAYRCQIDKSILVYPGKDDTDDLITTVITEI